MFSAIFILDKNIGTISSCVLLLTWFNVCCCLLKNNKEKTFIFQVLLVFEGFYLFGNCFLQSERKTKHKKSKDKDKHKESSKHEKKHKRRSREETSSHRDELEEFLNGSASPPIDAAYEAI